MSEHGAGDRGSDQPGDDPGVAARHVDQHRVRDRHGGQVLDHAQLRQPQPGGVVAHQLQPVEVAIVRVDEAIGADRFGQQRRLGAGCRAQVQSHIAWPQRHRLGGPHRGRVLHHEPAVAEARRCER